MFHNISFIWLSVRLEVLWPYFVMRPWAFESSGWAAEAWIAEKQET